MRAYELVFVVHPGLDNTAFKELIAKVKGWITEAGGIISKEDILGKRKLSYRVRKQKEGLFVLFKTEMAPSFCAQLEHNFLLADPVLRFLIVAEE